MRRQFKAHNTHILSFLLVLGTACGGGKQDPYFKNTTHKNIDHKSVTITTGTSENSCRGFHLNHEFDGAAYKPVIVLDGGDFIQGQQIDVAGPAGIKVKNCVVADVLKTSAGPVLISLDPNSIRHEAWYFGGQFGVQNKVVFELPEGDNQYRILGLERSDVCDILGLEQRDDKSMEMLITNIEQFINSIYAQGKQ